MLTISRHSRPGAVSLAAAGVIGLSACGSGGGATCSCTLAGRTLLS